MADEVPGSIWGAGEFLGYKANEVAGMIFIGLSLRYGKTITRSIEFVLRAIFAHANRNNNRVFASLACLRDSANTPTTILIASQTTVETGMALLRSLGAIRLITGAELDEDDNPSRAPERGVKKKGRHPVNTHSIAGLFEYLAPADRFRFLSAWKKVRNKEELRQAGRSISPPTSDNFDSTTLHSSGSPPPSVSVVGLGIGNGTQNPVTGKGRTKPDHQTNERKPPGNPVPNSKNWDSYISSQYGVKPESLPAIPSTRRGKWTMEEMEAIDALKTTGLRYNRVHGNVPFKIVETTTTEWALDLAEFFYWRQRRNEPVEPKYLVGMWLNYLNRDFEWPPAFETERSHRARARSAAKKRAPRPPDRPQAKRVAATPAPTVTPPLDLSIVPVSEQEELLINATEAVLEDRTFKGPGTEKRRQTIIREGWNHPAVRRAAARIWQEKQKG